VAYRADYSGLCRADDIALFTSYDTTTTTWCGHITWGLYRDGKADGHA